MRGTGDETDARVVRSDSLTRCIESMESCPSARGSIKAAEVHQDNGMRG